MLDGEIVQDFSWSNKDENFHEELPWFPSFPPPFPAFPLWFPWFLSFPEFPPWFPTFSPDSPRLHLDSPHSHHSPHSVLQFPIPVFTDGRYFRYNEFCHCPRHAPSPSSLEGAKNFRKVKSFLGGGGGIRSFYFGRVGVIFLGGIKFVVGVVT